MELFFFVVLSLCAFTQSNAECPTFLRPEERLDCGEPGSSQEACENRGCCWDSSMQNTIWCFQKKGCSNVPVHKRVDCGYVGISQEQCLDNGCCWDNTVSDSIWCFRKQEATISSPSICPDGVGNLEEFTAETCEKYCKRNTEGRYIIRCRQTYGLNSAEHCNCKKCRNYYDCNFLGGSPT